MHGEYQACMGDETCSGVHPPSFATDRLWGTSSSNVRNGMATGPDTVTDSDRAAAAARRPSTNCWPEVEGGIWRRRDRRQRTQSARPMREDTALTLARPFVGCDAQRRGKSTGNHRVKGIPLMGLPTRAATVSDVYNTHDLQAATKHKGDMSKPTIYP